MSSGIATGDAAGATDVVSAETRLRRLHFRIADLLFNDRLPKEAQFLQTLSEVLIDVERGSNAYALEQLNKLHDLTAYVAAHSRSVDVVAEFETSLRVLRALVENSRSAPSQQNAVDIYDELIAIVDALVALYAAVPKQPRSYYSSGPGWERWTPR